VQLCSFCAANQKREFDKLIKENIFNLPQLRTDPHPNPTNNFAMSSVKRRKVDGDVPSGLLKKKENPAKEQAPASASASSEPAAAPEEQQENVEEATKTFKDLVCIVKANVRSSNLQYLGNHRFVMRRLCSSRLQSSDSNPDSIDTPRPRRSRSDRPSRDR